MAATRLSIRDLAKWLAFALALALFARILLGAEGAGALSLVRERGLILLLGLLPFFVFELFDSTAWRELIAPLAGAPRFFSVLRTRLSAEALNLTLPAGTAVSEAMTPSLLHRLCGLPTGDGVVALAVRRWTILRGHSVYLVLAGAVSFGTAAHEHAWLPWALFGCALLAIGISDGVRRLFEQNHASARLERLLERLPGRLHHYFQQRRAAFAAVDHRFREYGHAEKRHWLLPTGLYVAAWLTEAAETFLLLRLLGATVSFGQVLPVEAMLSFVRSVAFVAPAGLGVQDLGYVTLFNGLPRATVLAFVALKRGKELVWASVGYLSLLLLGKAPAPVAQEAHT